MRSFSDILLGAVELRITGGRTERFLNVLAREGVWFTNALRVDEITLSIRIHRRDLAAVQELAKRSFCECTAVSETGLPRLWGRIRLRRALLIMPALCLMAVMALSLFIWDISISGSETLTDAEILAALDSEGIRTGAFGLCIDRELLRERLIEALPKLAWITVNVRGSRAEVIVRERVEPPEVVDVRSPADIIAAKTGLITEMNVFEGRAEAERGQMVLAGETLVSGTLGSLSGRVRRVHALGEIRARTWYEISEKTPLEYISKRYTGETVSRKSVAVGNYRINLYINGSISLDCCDKITDSKRLELPGGLLLPIRLTESEYREYEAVPAEMSISEAEELLKPRLLQRLRRELNGEPLSLEFITVEEEGFVTVTLRAECLENIAMTVPAAEHNTME